MWGVFKKIASNDNNKAMASAESSFFDVKELYDAAYAEKEKTTMNIKCFQSLMNQAERLDEAYRAQLAMAQTQRYKKTA